jgi:hypothetical protein
MQLADNVFRRFIAAYAEELGRALAQVTAVSAGAAIALLITRVGG